MKTFKEFLDEQQVDEGLGSLLIKGAKAAKPYVMPVVKKAREVVSRVVNKAERRIAPKVNNYIAYPRLPARPPGAKGIEVSGNRYPTGKSAETATHAYRRMDQTELARANRRGYFEKTPDVRKTSDGKDVRIKTTWSKDKKGFAAGDETERYLRQFKSGPNPVDVRLPVGNVPLDGRALSVKAPGLEVKSPTGWVPAIDKSLGARVSRVGYKAGRVLGINEDV